MNNELYDTYIIKKGDMKHEKHTEKGKSYKDSIPKM